MGAEERQQATGEPATDSQFAVPADQGEVSAWEQVDTGRYMPRRIKGSCKGRALG